MFLASKCMALCVYFFKKKKGGGKKIIKGQINHSHGKTQISTIPLSLSHNLLLRWGVGFPYKLRRGGACLQTLWIFPPPTPHGVEFMCLSHFLGLCSYSKTEECNSIRPILPGILHWQLPLQPHVKAI